VRMSERNAPADAFIWNAHAWKATWRRKWRKERKKKAVVSLEEVMREYCDEFSVSILIKITVMMGIHN
jgi:ribosomal protein L21E